MGSSSLQRRAPVLGGVMVVMEGVRMVVDTVTTLGFLQWFLLLGLFCLYQFKRYMDEFKRWPHIPQVPPHWFLGNKSFGGKSFKDTYLDHYKDLAPHRFGLFWEKNEPTIFLRDIELIKRVQVTDFEHFMDFGFLPNEFVENAGNQFGVADLRGESWRKMKRMVTPPFSVPRLKKTLPAMNTCGHRLAGYLQSNQDKDQVDAVLFSKKFFMNCIASIGFGIDIDTYGDVESEFEKQGNGLLSLSRFIVIALFPSIATMLGLRFINKTSEKFFMDVCKKIVEQRRAEKADHRDIMDNLMKVAEDNPELTEEMMFKTCVQFFTDGYESVAMVMSVVFYYLTVYPDIQTKLQEELDEVMERKEDHTAVEQTDLNDMVYLDQVLKEGTRLGCLANTARNCIKPYKIPDSDFVIPKNTRVIIPTVGLHYDPAIWPDPETFDPERFSAENKGKIDSVTFQPFGFGPRQCLGQNLMMIESKILLIHVLRNFSLKPVGEMPQRMIWDKDGFIGKKNVYIKLVPRSAVGA